MKTWIRVAALILVASPFVYATPPALINFQGRLLDGTNLYSGPVSLALRVYTNAVGGDYLYEDSNTLNVADGIYSTLIGDDTTFGTLTNALVYGEAYVGVVANGHVMSPRFRLASSAYAIEASQAANASMLAGLPASGFATTSAVSTANNNLQLQIIALSISIGNLDASKVNRAGDTMTGALVINDAASGSLRINSTQSRIAIGAGITNLQDQTALLRGSLYLDGATGVFIRPVVGSGPWSNLVAGLATGSPVYVESDPAFTNAEPLIFWTDGSRAMTGDLNMGGYSISNLAVNSITFTDGTTISSAQITNWDQTYAWGNHNTAGYATGTFVVSESDPLFTASVASAITAVQTGQWSQTFGWGDHAAAGYATGAPVYVENDPVWTAEKTGYATNNHLHSAADITSGTLDDARLSAYVSLLGASIESSEIADGTISFADIGQNGATNGQIMKWNGSAWTYADDNTGEVGGAFWSLAGNSGITAGTHFVGTTEQVPLDIKAAGKRVIRVEGRTNGANIVMMGSQSNVIESTVVGSSVLGGGDEVVSMHRITADYSTIAGGLQNRVRARESIIGGGFQNTIWDGAERATVAGGSHNEIQTNGYYGTIAGGYNNKVDSQYAAILGGNVNSISTNSTYSVILGGYNNVIRSGPNSIVAGNESKIMDGGGIVFGGGMISNATGIVLGNSKIINGALFGFAAGGSHVIDGAQNNYAAIVGGSENIVGSNSYWSTILGGRYNTISNAQFSAIVGGDNNTIRDVSYQSAYIIGHRNTIMKSDSVIIGHNNRISNDTTTAKGWVLGEQNVVEGIGVVLGQSNYVTGGVYYVTIGGGLNNRAHGTRSVIAGGEQNYAGGDGAVVGGGTLNRGSGSFSVIAGGRDNTSHADYSVIGGGQDNIISNCQYSTIPGGSMNVVTGSYAFAAGRRAIAQAGSFVWADANNADFTSTVPNQFAVRSVGGARFVSGIIGVTSGVQLASGGGSWTSLSDRNAKENFEAVDGAEVLARLNEVPILRWNYKTQEDSVRHIGPTSQDFMQAFGVGESDTGITSVDADGVALVAIQELYRQNLELRRELEALREEIRRGNDDGIQVVSPDKESIRH